MNDPGMGHFKEPLKDFATLGLSLPCVKWLHGGHPRTEERGGDIITLRHPPSLLSWMQVLVDTPRGGLAAPESNLMIRSPPQAYPAYASGVALNLSFIISPSSSQISISSL